MIHAALLLAALALAGCASDPAPVGESKVVTRAAKAAAGAPRVVGPAPAFHVVERGDTLFSIAWRHGLDYREVARINGIAEPWVIRVGQKLRLREAGGGAAGKAPSARTEAARESAAPAPRATPRSPAAGVTTATGGSSAGAVRAPAAPSSPVPAPAGSSVTAGRTAAVPSPPPAVSPDGWAWPSAGRVLAAYSPGGSGPRGIALDGAAGDPVRAARDGRVVYTGSSLVGYGQLVILKHDEVYLSAYAHNSRLLVKEGDRVRAGDVIAEMGSTGADRVKLHFEIRRNGEPVDPQGLLPRR